MGSRRDVVVGGINLSQLTCNPGYELDAGFMCYPQCNVGYSPVSFLCWSTCNQVQVPDPNGIKLRNTGDDWHDDGALCRKRLYDRGIGYIPDGCPDNLEIFEGLCYQPCTDGFVETAWSPVTCSQPCPPNTVEGGFANCTKVNSYGRGAGNQGNGCPSGYDNLGLYCYRWWLPDIKAFVCPGGDYDPQNNPNGTCKYKPGNGLDGLGRNQCFGNSINVGALVDKNGNANPNYPAGNISVTDRENTFSAYGCYPDPNNPLAWLPPSDPTYYLTSYYPKWHPSSGCTRDNTVDYVRYYCPDKNLPNDPTQSPALEPYFPGGVYSNVSIPYPTLNNPDLGLYNTRRSPGQSSQCEENWGSLCYPKCDIGYINAACCVCSPTCGSLKDEGATCHRDWYSRPPGKLPSDCNDPNRVLDEGLCYTKCKQDFISFCTTCTRTGCPYGGKGETALVCSKDAYYRGPGTFAIPGVTGKINSKINIGQLSGALKRIIINALFILLCLVAALFIFSTNIFLRTKRVSVK